MGKMMMFVAILIFIDLMFIITGQAVLPDEGVSGIGSIIFSNLLNLEKTTFSKMFTALIGDLGDLVGSATNNLGSLAALLAGAGIAIGVAVTKSESLLFVPVAIALGSLTTDFVVIYVALAAYNGIMATLAMAPIILLFILTMVEWTRGKD